MALREVVRSKSRNELLSELATFMLTLVLSSLLLRMMWNRSLVPHITVLKPIATLSEAFALSMALSVLKCC